MRMSLQFGVNWLALCMPLLVAAAWLHLHGERVRMLRVAMPAGVACSVVREPGTVWILLDRDRPQQAQAELFGMLSTWPTAETGEDLSPLTGLAVLPESAWGAEPMVA